MNHENDAGVGIANPAPLGLMGFGMTTIMLNLHNAGFFPVNMAIIAMGIVFGGFAQIIAGVMEFKKDNQFGALAFTSYGCFWIILSAIFVFGNVDSVAMGCFLTVWGLFSVVLFIGTFSQSMTNRIVFGTLVLLFALLAASKFAGGELGAFLGKIAGYEGILCGLCAFYGAAAMVLNDCYKKKVLPL